MWPAHNYDASLMTTPKQSKTMNPFFTTQSPRDSPSTSRSGSFSMSTGAHSPHQSPSSVRCGSFSATSICELPREVQPCTTSCIQLAWKGLQHAMGPCQLWVYCDPNFRYCVSFVSTSLDAWLDHAAKNENKILFGVLGFNDNGVKKFVQVLRVGQDLTDEEKTSVHMLKKVPFDTVFTDCEGEISIDMNDDRESIKQKVSELTKIDASRIRL